MAGLKAAIKWFSRERLPAGNGMFIMCGVLGAFAATVPAEFLLRFVSWRGLSAILRVATCLVALLVWRIVPDTARASAQAEKPMRLRDVVRDPMFRRFAPLSASCFGTVLAVQGLWAGPRLADVNG